MSRSLINQNYRGGRWQILTTFTLGFAGDAFMEICQVSRENPSKVTPELNMLRTAHHWIPASQWWMFQGHDLEGSSHLLPGSWLPVGVRRHVTEDPPPTPPPPPSPHPTPSIPHHTPSQLKVRAHFRAVHVHAGITHEFALSHMIMGGLGGGGGRWGTLAQSLRVHSAPTLRNGSWQVYMLVVDMFHMICHKRRCSI